MNDPHPPKRTRKDSWQALHRDVIACNRCARLRDYGAQVTPAKRYADWKYWGKPVTGFGDHLARLWIIGLAPAAHGGNRTGRIFTGDRSGDFLFAALHRVGMANQPSSVHREDGLALEDCYISATARCAPPANKPLPEEIANCSIFLDREWGLLSRKRVLMALGKIAWDAALQLARRQGITINKPRPTFGHGAEYRLAADLVLVGSYHVSQQNTFTGTLTEAMFDGVLRRCRALCDGK
ncbi:MAG: uracil-DNA glycosylase [Phycisphaerales bacterium]|jgi:uracil-DNA glycosylase family 4|nr:uracil-DNA glycosylase [Phycisphaerales bacterium]